METERVRVDEAASFSVKQLLFVVIFVIGCEAVQMKYEQSFKIALVHVGFAWFFCWTLISLDYVFFGMFSVVAWEILETISWITIGSNVTFQIFAAIDVSYLINSQRTLLMLGICLVFGVFFVVLWIARRVTGWRVSYPLRFLALIAFACSIFFCSFAMLLYKSFYPFNGFFFLRSELPESHARIAKILTEVPRVTKVGPKRKNLIVFQLESVELGQIGRYSVPYPELTPYLSEIAGNGTIARNMTVQRYSSSTAAGTFVSQCSFPHLSNDKLDWSEKRHTHITIWDTLPCISTYLQMAGYDLYCYMSFAARLMGIQKFFENRGFDEEDTLKHGFSSDWDLMEYVADKKLPGIIAKGKPFYLRIITENTHIPFFVDGRCSGKGLLPDKSYPRAARSTNCLDEIMERFMKRIRELGLNENNTEVVIHPDHLNWGKSITVGQRFIYVMFPWREKHDILKEVTMYDIPVSILDALDIEYQPPFAFGASIFSDQIGSYPDQTDFEFIQHVKNERLTGIRR